MDGIDKLYQGLSAVYDLGTPEEFRKKIADEEHRKKLYEQVSPNIDLGVADYPAFSQKIDGYLQQPERLPLLQASNGGNAFMPLAGIANRESERHIAEKEAQMQREEQAQLPITDHDRQLQEQIRQMEIEGKWGKPNGTTFGVDKQTGMPTITKTEGDGMHLYAGEQLANQDEIDALKGQLPSYLTREVKTPQDLLVNTAEAWSSNTEMGRDFKDMLDAGTITPEEYKQAMIDANQDYINQQTRILSQKATNATIADISRTINPIIEQLQAERREAMQRAAGQGQMRGGAYGAIGAQMSANTAYDSKKDAVLSEYLQAQQYLVDAVKISEAAQKGEGFWKGLGKSVGDADTWDFGISQLVRSANLKKIVEKYEKQPDRLTDSEKALMDAAVAYMSACAYNSDKLSRLYKAGQTTGESLPFMLQFAIMPIGAIKDKVAKGILGYGIEQFGGKALQTAGKYTFGRAAAETGTALLGNMAAAGVQTAAFGVPKIAEGTISRMTGDIKPEFDENGRIVYGGRENQQGVGEALWNAGVDMYVENLSEMILTSGDPIKAFVRGTNLFKNLTKNEAIQVLTKMSEKWGESTMGKMAGRMQFRNYPEEVAEEYVGNLLRWGASTDVNSAAEAGLDADSQIDLWMGLAPTSIVFAGLGLGEYSVRGGIDRFQSSQAARKLRKIMLEGEERKYLENLLKSRDSDEFKFAAHDVVKSILRNDKLSAREKRAYLDNLYVTYQSQLALEAEDAKIADEVKTEVQGITNKYNGYVYPVSLAGDPNTQGHIVAGYVEVDESDPSKPRIGNDEIVTVKLNDGRVVQLSTKELDLTGTPQMAQQVFNTRAEERINAQRLIDKSKSAFHEGEEGTIQVPNPQTGELDELPSKILSVTDEGVQVEITDFAGQSTTALISHDEALRSLRVVKPQEVQQEQPQAQETPAEQPVVQQPEAAVEPTADNIVIFSNGTEVKQAIDNGDGTYTIMEKGENNEDIPFKQSEEWLNDRGYARVETEQPETPIINQIDGKPISESQAIKEGLTVVVPNIYTASTDDYVRATVENKYKGNKAKAQANIAAQLNGAKSELQAAQREFEKFKNKGITSKMNSDQWDEQYDQYEAQIQGLTALVSKLEAANIAAAHYKTQAELQEEAERKAREAAMREQRRQLAEAEAAGDIEAKWQNTKKTVGFAATKTLPNGQKVNGHYILTEAGDVIPSHDPRKNYADSDGYVMENGQNVNDNNYKDPEVQKIAIDIAQNYGGQAVEQMPFLENKAGRVLSGNNRTISGIIAAENNTDQAYLAALAENAQQYGFTPEQLAEYQHPRLQFVVEDELPFTTGTFAMFNQQEKKTKSSVNRAVANSKMVTEAVRDRLLEIMDQYDSLDSFFGSSNAASAITQTLINEGLMTKQEVAEKMDDSGIFNQTGKEYVTDMLLGTLFDEQTIRMLAGEKTLKQAILRALPSIVENRRLKGYELTENINKAISLLYEARKANKGKSTAEAFQLYLRQVDAFKGKVKDNFSEFEIILAGEMANGVERTRDLLNMYNNSAENEANGQDSLLDKRTPEDIKQQVYEHYAKQQPELTAAINGAAVEGAESQSSVPSSTEELGEVRQVISPEKLAALRQQAQEFSDKLGVPIVVFDSIDEVPDSEKAAKELYEKEGNKVDAWMSADGKTIYVNANSPEIQKEGGLQRKVFHEVVAHKGLRQLLGNQTFGQLCAYVWEAMPVDQRVKYYDYAQQNYPGRSEDELRLIAADEYMAFNAEKFTSLDANDQSEAANEVRTIWQKIADKLRELLDKILGDSYMSDDALAELYKMSYNNLRQQAQTPGGEQPKPVGESNQTPQGKAPQTPSEVQVETATEDELYSYVSRINSLGNYSFTLSDGDADVVKFAKWLVKKKPDAALKWLQRGNIVTNSFARKIYNACVEKVNKLQQKPSENPTEDNAHLSDNESAFVAPQMPIDTQTNAQKQSKTPTEEEQQQAAQYLNEALQEVISKSGDKLPQNITIDENTIEDNPDSVEMTARLLIDGKPSDFSVTIFDQSLGARGGFDPVNMVKFYPREELDKWDWDLADRLAEEFNKTRTQESGLATVMDESDAVYFFNMQAALDFAEKARQEIAPTDNRETSETRATEIEIGGALVDRLGDMGVSVSTDLDANRAALKAAKKDKSEAGAIHYYKTPSGQQYGFSYKGKVYLDPTKINAELPLHEYGHLWAEALRRLNPENWQHVVDTIKADKDAWEFVKSLRPELTDENDIAEEVIATFSGKKGAERLKAEYDRMHGKDADYKSKWGNIFKNISKAIQDFWKAVGDFLNIKYESAEQVYDQVLKDFVDNMNPWKRVSDFLRQRDAEYVQAAESGDIKTATNIFYEALKENIGNGITPYMSVGTYNNLKRLAKGVKTRDAALIKEAADLIAPLIPDNAVLIPAPSHSGTATDMLDLAKAIAEVTGSEVADVLRSAPRESQYQAKKTTGVPMASKQLGIAVEGEIPADKTPIIIDNVVDSGNTAEACVQAVGKGVVVTLADSAEQYGHAASLKSAAPVLRDKDGKVIPLSKRFDLSGSRYLGRRMYLRPDDLRLSVSGTLNKAAREEMQQIKDAALADGTFMKAPNGKPTKLNERQWLLVRTQAFKRWFGDWENDPQNASKVVDENGEPMVVYHGTGKQFNVFTLNNIANGRAFGNGFYFADNPNAADTYAPYEGKRIVSVFLNIHNPLVTTTRGEKAAIDVASVLDNYGNISVDLSKKGYDGIIVNDMSVGGNMKYGFDWVPYTEYITITPNQIKSATHNDGSFSEDNDDIRFSVSNASEEMQQIKDAALADGTFMKAPNGKRSNLNERQWLQVRTRAFKRWFGDWENDPQNATKVLDKNGEPLVVYHGSPFEFTQFDNTQAPSVISRQPSSAFAFSTSETVAKGYSIGTFDAPEKSNAKAFFVNLRNPLVVDVKGKSFLRAGMYLEQQYPELSKYTYPELFDFNEIPIREMVNGKLIQVGVRRIIDYDAIKKDGIYDGVILRNVNDPSREGFEEIADTIFAFNPNQIKSATHNDGSFSEDNDDIRFSVSNASEEIFFSNAERAVESIKQEKATPAQWLAMIEKAGGLKAGEDKWIGLSDWLKAQHATVEMQPGETRSQYIVRLGEASKKFTVSKQDILDYIRQNKIQIEEVEYGEYDMQDAFEGYRREYKQYYDEAVADNSEDPQEVAWQRMIDEHGDDFDMGFYAYGDELQWDADSDYVKWELENSGESGLRHIDDTRMRYTTHGLQNKREIALTVPTIESWNEDDNIHFGDAGEGRAVAWVRFGDTRTISKPEELQQAEKESKDFSLQLIKKYGFTYTESDMTEEEQQKARELEAKLQQARKDHPQEESKVLVIDEIQSKRHQEGREHGYIEKSADKAMTDYTNMLYRKYGVQFNVKMSDEERMEYRRLQREREFERQDNLSRPTAAPFEKNWHELAMKRILRFAAENGYDKVAWTTGDQQAERYNIGHHVDGIDAIPFKAGVEPHIDYDGTQVLIYTQGDTLDLNVNGDGVIVEGNGYSSSEYEGKQLADVVGKEIAKKLLTGEEVKLRGEDFRIGGEGMKGFYDEMLPRFMQKYGKKWGVQVGEVTMPDLEEGYQTMHSIDITPEMRESVLQGQPMFSVTGSRGTMDAQPGENKVQYAARIAEEIKRENPKDTSLDEAIRFSITVNHNSPYLLKRADGAFVDPETGERLGFDLRFIGKGEGGQAHGYGSYFSVNDIRSYAENHLVMGDSEEAKEEEERIYSAFDIPGLNNTPYFGIFDDPRSTIFRIVSAVNENKERPQSLKLWLEDKLKESKEIISSIPTYRQASNEDWYKKREAKFNEMFIPVLLKYMKHDLDMRNRHHYTVEIPDNNGSNYLEEGKAPKRALRKMLNAMTDEQKERIASIPVATYTSGEEIFLKSDLESRILWLINQTGWRDLYEVAEMATGSQQAASELFSKAGFVGIHYDGRRDGECYVIFNPDDAVITDHIRFSVTGGINDHKTPVFDTQNTPYLDTQTPGVYTQEPPVDDFDDQIRFSVKYDPRSSVPKVRGGWTKEKILRYLKQNAAMAGTGKGMASRLISEFDSPAELKDHMFYHGTVYGPAALKPSITMSERDAERYGGGGYGDRYWGISLTKDKKIASNFSGTSRSVKIYPVILAKNANVIERPDFSDAYDLEDHIVELWEQGVDAVWIGEGKQGKGEQELCVLNPRAICVIDRADWYDVYNMANRITPLKIVDDEHIEKMYNAALEYQQRKYDKPRYKGLYPMSDEFKVWEIGITPEERAKRRAEYEAALQEYRDGKREFENTEEAKAWRDYEREVDDTIRFSVNNPSTLSRSETVTKALVQQANNNYNIMQSALKKVTADLKGIRAAMRMQSDYDRKVVDALLNLYNTLLQENGVWAQYMPDTTRRIATQIVHAIGKQNITEEVNTIMDHMVHAQAKAAQRQWDKLRQTPIDKINISGVVMQGKVALEGQHAIKAMNDALQANMTIEQIEEQINQLMDMEDNATDESLKTQYKGQWIGLTIAAQHLERLQHLQEERQQLDLELQSARSNKALKPAARQQLVENIKQAMRDNYIEQAEAYTRSTQDLSEYVNTQEGRAKDFIRRQDANRDKIRSYAQRDLRGISTDNNRDESKVNIVRSIWDAVASPIRDLQSLLRLCGRHAPDGEGYLYNHFMRNWMDAADTERLGIVAASKTLDAKIAELTHGKYKTWEEAARKINDASHNMFTVTTLNGIDGEDMPYSKEMKLSAGNALYIYAVNKMNDGRMKLNGMNITEEDVKALVDAVREKFGQEILDVVDWIQSEFFSQLRDRYNPTHIDLFGAPMDAIENYFPLRLSAAARKKNVDLGDPDTDVSMLLSGSTTGAIKRRTKNSIPIDLHADFFKEVIRHVAQMERWNAFAQWTRDANILFSDTNFRERVKNMDSSVYGKGDALYNYMRDAFKVANGTYRQTGGNLQKGISDVTLNIAKGVTSAKINFRVWTAMKQIASFPAFFTYMQDGTFVKSYMHNWGHWSETMEWAKENLPNFEKRVSKRDMGDFALMRRSTDWKITQRIMDMSTKYGMAANVFFDTLTCATGARAVYDSHLADYMKKGYSEEDARNRARQDAEQAFNTSQQSSEGAFMAPVQADRNIITSALTVFRTSPIQYTRNFIYHTRGIARKLQPGAKEKMIAFRMGQYKNDGLTDEQARKAAEMDFDKSMRQDIVGFVVYGAVLNILWRLAGNFLYYLFGDDDDKKKELLLDAVTGGAFVSSITGLLGGSNIESKLDGHGSISGILAPELPLTQDAKKAEQYLDNNKYAEFASQALSILMQSSTGFDPQTAVDAITRVVVALDSEQELDAAQQSMFVLNALLSIPQSQYEQMLIDKVVSGETDEDAALEDYIRYQKIHTAPLTWWLRGEESDEKAEENAEKRFNKLLTDRDKIKNPEDYEE